MKLVDLGENALKDYKPVKYFPFENEAAAPYILTSDPLGYLEAYINTKHASIKRDNNKLKSRLEKARYFTQLSKDFFESSQTAKMPSKGTLIYYSFINLVKVFLIINKYELETKLEHHGLTLPADKKLDLKLANNVGDGISIFHEFAKVLGKPIDHSSGLEINFIDLLRNLPEVHEIGYALNLFPGTKRKFLPVEISIKTNIKKDKLFYTLSYEKKFDDIMKVAKLKANVCKEKITEIAIEDDSRFHHFKSFSTIGYTKNSKKSWKMCYPKLVSDINCLVISPLLTRGGFRFYLDLEPFRLHRLSTLLAFAYYIGTVARYRPTLNEEILKGKYQSIINEAIIACPNQFFYLMVSHITKQVCAIPMAKID